MIGVHLYFCNPNLTAKVSDTISPIPCASQCTFYPYYIITMGCLVVVLIGLVVNDVEELQLVDALGGRDNAQPVAELLLLEELLGPGERGVISASGKNQTAQKRTDQYSQVLEVSAGELIVGDDLNLALASLLDDNGVAEVTDTAFNLDLVLEELLEGGGIEYLVARGLLGVDDELGSSVSIPACAQLSQVWRRTR